MRLFCVQTGSLRGAQDAGGSADRSGDTPVLQMGPVHPGAKPAGRLLSTSVLGTAPGQGTERYRLYRTPVLGLTPVRGGRSADAGVPARRTCLYPCRGARLLLSFLDSETQRDCQFLVLQ